MAALSLPLAALPFAVSIAIAPTPASAVEDAKSIYLLGIKGPMAGFVPPPGTYLTSYSYGYSGDASGNAAASVALERFGNLTVEADLFVDAKAAIELANLLWVTPQKVLNGNLALGAFLPVGWQETTVDVDALAMLTLPDGRTFQAGARFSRSEQNVEIGDPLFLAMIGWHQGNWHWNLAGLVNVPVGEYHKDDIVNMGFNRWAFDASGAVTWLDPKKGHEVSLAAGFTFNGENPDTDYRSGTEFHFEYALMQHFSQAFAIGVAGFIYEQVTGDSGAGATLGPFKGRASAIGPSMNYNFNLGHVPVATSLRWYHEYDVKNRLEGDSVFLVATIPLGAPAPAAGPVK